MELNWTSENKNKKNEDEKQDKKEAEKDFLIPYVTEDSLYFEPSIEELKKFQQKLQGENIHKNILNFYKIKGQEINNENYLQNLKFYFNEISKKEKEVFISNRKNNINKSQKRIIFVHDSSMQIRSIFFKNKNKNFNF